MNSTLQAYNVMASHTPSGTPQWSINLFHTHLFYHVAQTNQAQHGSLVDRRDNGEPAGSDMRIHSKNYSHPVGDGEPPWAIDPQLRDLLDANFDAYGLYTKRAINTLSSMALTDTQQPPPMALPSPMASIQANQHNAKSETPDYDIGELNNLKLWGVDIGNAHLETATHGSELVAAKTAAEQILDLRNTLRYLGVPIKSKSYMFGDNRSVGMSATLLHSTLSKKHNILAFHNVRRAIATKIMDLHWIQSKHNLSCMLSKHWKHIKIFPMLQKLLITYGPITLVLKSSTDETLKLSK